MPHDQLIHREDRIGYLDKVSQINGLAQCALAIPERARVTGGREMCFDAPPAGQPLQRGRT